MAKKVHINPSVNSNGMVNLFILFLLVVGIFVGSFLVQIRTNYGPKAHQPESEEVKKEDTSKEVVPFEYTAPNFVATQSAVPFFNIDAK